jgi:prepilin-type N-terminal cleavage/methylation domain-containing protein
MNRQEKKKSTGFTLIELMIVVVIIGILAAMAIPRFMKVSTKAKQSEAKQLLKQVYSMQRAYFAMNESYCLNNVVASNTAPTAFAQIHVDVMTPARYSYLMTVPTRATFLCTATANLDDDAIIDTWTIDNNGDLICTINDAED